MVMGRSRGDDGVDNVQPHLVNTQQLATVRGWGGGDEDNEEEEHDGCWTMISEVHALPHGSG